MKKIFVRVLISIVLIAASASVALYAVSERKLNAAYPVAAEKLRLSLNGASAGRGEHIVKAVGTCTLCHGEDLGGAVYAEMGPIGIVAGPNLTRGSGGAAASFSVEDWVRAVRFGVRRDGTSLIAMPSEVYTNMADEDLASVILYARSVPPVDRQMPRSAFGPLGRALLAIGKLKLLVAPKTHQVDRPARMPVAPTKEYGRYLADVSGCHGCHGFGLSGGKVAGPPGLPPAANLTPAGIGNWKEQDFVMSLRHGRDPAGRQVNEFMPWKSYRAMTDDELHALWLYLRSVPVKASGGK